MSVCRLFLCDCGKQSYVSNKQVTKLICTCGLRMRMLPNFYISYTVKGKKKVEAVSPSRKQAEMLHRKRVVDAKEEKFFKKDPTVSWNKAVGLLEEYLETANVNTGRMHRNSLVALNAFFKGRSVRDITPGLVERFKALRAGQVSPSSINRELATLKKIVALCLDNDMLRISPIERVRPLQENPSRERVLSAEEYDRLLTECRRNPRLFLAVFLVSQTGLRKEAVYSLAWDNVHLKDRYLEQRGKRGKMAVIPLTEALYTVLHNAKEASTSEWVFPSPEHPQAHISKNSNLGFPEACARAEIPDLRFHDLRHSFATRFVIATGDKEACRVLLGHSKMATTDLYVNVPSRHIRQSMETFERET